MKHKIAISQHFNAPVSEVFEYLSVHENLSQIFAPAKVVTVKHGTTDPYGVGSVRHVCIPLAPVTEETVTQYVVNQLIEYKITNFSPIKNHLGTMLFIDLGEKSRLEYTLQFQDRIPGLGLPIKWLLETSIKRGLKKLFK